MSSFLGGLGTGLASLVPGGLSYLGTKQTNAANREIAKEQMEFQERMSSSAYQRAVLDMEQAGLNPIMAYSQGGASSPSGASIQQQNELGNAVSSALDVARTRAELDNMREQKEMIKAQTQMYRRDADVKSSTAKSLDLQMPGLEAQAHLDKTPFGPISRLIKMLNPLNVFIK